MEEKCFDHNNGNLSEPEDNRFETTASNVEEAYAPMQLIDSDCEGDSDIDTLN